MRSKPVLPPVLLAAMVWISACPAKAAIAVFGNGFAHLCSEGARHLPLEQPAVARFIDDCSHAISDENLSIHDLAGSHINRGVLLVARGDYAAASRDFDAAANLMPDLGEAYTDRGAALLGLRHYAEAIAAVNRGLALNTTEPEKAYFDRAVAEEALDDVKSAYFDYLKASQLKPDWAQPRNELGRFTATPAGPQR